MKVFPYVISVGVTEKLFWGLGFMGLGLQKAQNEKKKKKLDSLVKVGTLNVIHANLESSLIPPILQFPMASLPILLSGDYEQGRIEG